MPGVARLLETPVDADGVAIAAAGLEPVPLVSTETVDGAEAAAGWLPGEAAPAPWAQPLASTATASTAAADTAAADRGGRYRSISGILEAVSVVANATDLAADGSADYAGNSENPAARVHVEASSRKLEFGRRGP